VRERCKGLFEQLKWAELLELCEGTLASGVGAGWVDLHRFSAASMGQLGGAHRPVRAEIVRVLRECLSKHPWLLDATLSDGTQAADDTSRGWIAAEVSPDAGEGSGSEASGAAAAPTGGGLLDEARELLSSDGLEKAIGLLQKSAGDARWGRERACALQDLGTLCLEAERGDLAIPVLERLCDELRRARVEDWEGPDFLGGALEALYGSYTLISDRTAAQTARMRDIADELAKVDLGRRLRLDESKL
jgi:hypothetical protein